VLLVDSQDLEPLSGEEEMNSMADGTLITDFKETRQQGVNSPEA
jgi:hypothetical protein